MSSQITLQHPTKKIHAEIVLNGSKSIANRALLIQALCLQDFHIDNLPNAADTIFLQKCLQNKDVNIFAGAGGTTYRFLTAFYAVQEGRTVLLSGTERMHQRPIKVLVDALQQLGADISYTEGNGYPPLLIKGKKLHGGTLSIPANVSSQFITALLLIAPTFSEGLTLHLTGTVVSLPYIQMTLSLIRFFGIDAKIDGSTIFVKNGCYKSRDFYVEADWSAASYFYSMAALADEADIILHGLELHSTQGDAIIAYIYNDFGVNTDYGKQQIRITKKANFVIPSNYRYDFLQCPDLAQTVISCCAALDIEANFQGLQTLMIKETDRVHALDTELSKIGYSLHSIGENSWQLAKSVSKQNILTPTFDTYEDHRMAMCLAPLSLQIGQLIINEPEVVEKSYPDYWRDISTCGFKVETH
jgi:3-phosphoshikimate 1-carboxyvinyltransferase